MRTQLGAFGADTFHTRSIEWPLFDALCILIS